MNNLILCRKRAGMHHPTLIEMLTIRRGKILIDCRKLIIKTWNLIPHDCPFKIALRFRQQSILHRLLFPRNPPKSQRQSRLQVTRISQALHPNFPAQTTQVHLNLHSLRRPRFCHPLAPA